MVRLAMSIDLERCVGCNSCAVACKQENDVRLGISWDNIKKISSGNFLSAELFFLPITCQHCKDPICLKVCPTGATTQTKYGLILIDDKKCMGCKYCLLACPYNIRFYNPDKRVMEKCHLCVHLIAKKEEPFCVKACITKARVFGDLDDPKSEISQVVKRKHGRPLMPEMGTDPSFRYLPYGP